MPKSETRSRVCCPTRRIDIGGREIQQMGWWYPLMPIGIGTSVMLLIAILINNLARHRRYPRLW
ncbi:HPP family protein [Halomonas sp. TRM85114]|uniref:HPP family protein n=1 Tax=Halomonas jincaotanensis TaxID=2810616 RepID=UPI001BD3DAB1|nr:HPP family protein [Halomonas jincaotanensis]MBS9404596.1 HPP family protein [Halomonas jincaotanensis]